MRSKRCVLKIAFALVMTAALALVPAVASAHPHPPPPSASDTVYCNWTTSPPVIDGTMGAGEWTGAYVNNLTYVDFAAPGNTINVTVYGMNDATNMYLAFVVPDPTQSMDVHWAFFDNGHDGVLTDGDEDSMGIWTDWGGGGSPPQNDYEDLYWFDSLTGWTTDAVRDGNGRWSHAGANYTFEFSKPLNSGQAQDLAASPGDLHGLALLHGDNMGTTWYVWPYTALFNENDAGTYGHIQFANAPAGPTPAPAARATPVFPSLQVGMAAAFGAVVLAFCVRRRLAGQQ